MSDELRSGGKGGRMKSAFKENFNVLGLAGAAALSAALLNPLPLLVGLVAEAAYLLFVPDSKWYEARLSRRFDVEVAARINKLAAQVFPQLTTAMQERFNRLRWLRGEIGQNAPEPDADWFRQVLRKLDYLLEKFLLFARREAEFSAYLQTVMVEIGADRYLPRRTADDGEITHAIQAGFDAEIKQVTAQREQETDLNTQAILDKRLDVITQRHDHVERIYKTLVNLRHQMALLEDSFGLINDQLRARSPEQVLADIEGVVYQTDSMTQLLDELASVR
jgi:hypothetical protein